MRPMITWSTSIARCLALTLALVPLLASSTRATSLVSSASDASNANVAPPSSDDDARALAAYRTGDLETARSAWTSVLSSATSATSTGEKARLCYDLGNVAFRQKQVLEAVGWYSASLRLRPRDADTWFNLEHARSEAHLDPADRGDLVATLERVLSSLTAAESEWLVLAGAILWGLALGFEALRGSLLARRLAWSATLLLALSLVPWIYTRSLAHQDRELVVSTQPLSLASEPRAEAAHLGELAPGDECERLDELGDWVKVETDAGLVGWASRAGVFRLRR